MASSDIQIDKPQCGHPKRADMLLDVNINTSVQSINTERASLNNTIFNTIILVLIYVWAILEAIWWSKGWWNTFGEQTQLSPFYFEQYLYFWLLNNLTKVASMYTHVQNLNSPKKQEL